MNKTNTSSSFIRISGKIASWTMLSRILGFIRDLLFAYCFGASMVLDAFLVAFKIPNFMRRFFSEGAMTQAFVPIYKQKLMDNKYHAQSLASQTAIILSIFLSVLTIIVLYNPGWIIRIFAWGFINDIERFNLASSMIQWTFPFLIFIALTTLLSGVLNANNYFSLPASLPVVQNGFFIAGIILGTLWAAPQIGLCMSILIAGIAQFTIVFIFTLQKNYIGTFKTWQWQSIKQVFLAMAVIISGAIFTQINLVVDTVFASYLPRGSISWLYYSDRLLNLPIGVIAVSVATLLLPKLSDSIIQKNTHFLKSQINWGFQIIFAGAIPCVTMLLCFGKPILICLFHHGAFTARDIDMTYLALMAMTFGLPAFMLNKVLHVIFYAHKAIKEPTYIAFGNAVLAILLNIILVPHLHHVALALTASITSWNQCLILLHIANQKNWIEWHLPTCIKWTMAFLTALAATKLIQYLSPNVNWWLQHSTMIRFEFLFVIGIIVLFYYYLQLKWMGLEKHLTS